MNVRLRFYGSYPLVWSTISGDEVFVRPTGVTEEIGEETPQAGLHTQ